MGEVARRWNGLVHASIRFKLFTALCVAVGLSPILSFIPWWYDHGLVHVGEPCQWLTGALIPVVIALLAVIMPGSALPTPSTRADAVGDRGGASP
jgi:hypothetical protein